MEKLNTILFYNLDRAIRNYRNFAQRELKSHGFDITIDQWLVLKGITENPNMPQNELGKIVFKDNASVTRIIELLVKANYLDRSPHPLDRRKSKLKVTSKGIETLEQVQKIVEHNREIALQSIPKEALAQMNNHLITIAENCDIVKKT